MSIKREYWSELISEFLKSDADKIVGQLGLNNQFDSGKAQIGAWLEEIRILQSALNGRNGKIYFEYSIPRMGKRIDVVLLIGPVIFVLEFKVGEKEFTTTAIDQVWDYALDLKNFHESSHNLFISPILIATNSKSRSSVVSTSLHDGNNSQKVLLIWLQVYVTKTINDIILDNVQG